MFWVPSAQFNPGERITAPPFPDWHEIDHTLNFELPLAWTEEPALRLEVEVNDDRSVTEINFDNNTVDAFVFTLSCSGVNIAFSPVHYTPPEGYTPADPSANIYVGQEFLRKIFPVADKELWYSPGAEVRWDKSVNTEPGANEFSRS